MTRRRSLIFKFFLGCAALLAISLWLVASIEPSEIAAFLQSRLSQALQRPVTLGQAEFNFSQGIAFEIRDIGIGTLEGNGERLEIPALFVKPRVLPLFVGRLAFAELSCESPLLVLDINHQRGSKNGEPSQSPHTPLELPFGNLNLSNGTLKISDSSGIRLKAPLVIEKIQGRLRLTAKPFRARFSAEGKLLQDGHVCPWSLKGHITQAEEAKSWAENTLHFEASLGKLLPQVLLRDVPLITFLEDCAGSFQVGVKVNGIPSKGVEMETQLTGEGFSLVPSGSGGKRIAIEETHFKTRWTHTPQGETFDDIDINVNKVYLGGSARLEREGDLQRLKTELSSPVIPLDRLLALYPALSFFPGSTASKPEGKVQIKTLAYNGPLSAHLPDILAGVSGKMTFSHGRLPFPGMDGIKNLRFEINLADNQLSLEKGYLSYIEIPLQFQGTVKDLFSDDRALRLTAGGALPAEKLMNLPAFSAREGLALAGSTPLNIRIQGNRQKLLLKLEGDLSHLSVKSGDLVLKAADKAGRLEVTASTDFLTWDLEKASLATDLIKLEGQGHGNLGEAPDYEVQLALDPLDLEKIPRNGKLLKRLQPKGKISFVQNWQGGGGKPAQSRGVLTLKKADVHLTSILADLKGINGTVDITDGQAEFRNIMASLGNSPIMVSGILAGTPDPELHLSVKSPRIRADELIFPSDQYYLYDLDGTLTIDKNQIRFDEVHTSLEKGTVATVKGYVTFTQNPETRLQISSKNAVIDEVIALWSKPAKAKKKTEKKDGKGTLLIDVEAERGIIDRFRFQKASGQIRLKDNILVIHPLDFHSGPGYGNGQVLVVIEPGQPSLLKISGHVENFDAEAVSKELIRFGSLVTGTLRGDFYLEGRTGKTFLPTSRGEFNVEIQKGVLKKFKGLSKVFSILNVSQIFSLKLPDMATDGMPFNRATGTVQMRNGLLTSEDIVVDSDAMNLSLVGSMNLVEKKTDTVLGVKPLGTVDKIITHIPVAGWILAGEDKALVTAYFEIKGKIGDPEVNAVPMTSISRKAQGIFKRIFKLPEKMITETGELFREKKQP